MNKYGYNNCVGLLFLLYCSTATAGRIAPRQPRIDAEEVAPASQFVEGTLLIAFADVDFPIPGVTLAYHVNVPEELVIETDAETVVVKVLYAPADVSTLEDSSVKSLLHVLSNDVQFTIARVGGQFVGIVQKIEEGVSP